MRSRTMASGTDNINGFMASLLTALGATAGQERGEKQCR